MLMKITIRDTQYDSINDILYVHFSNDRGTSYSDGEHDGFEFMRDMDTDEITGMMVYYPKKKQEERQRDLARLGYSLNLSLLCN